MLSQKHPSSVLIQKFTKSIGLPFQELLPRATIEEILRELGIKYRNRIYNPIVIVWSFISQVLDPDHSCKNAVSRIIAHKGRRRHRNSIREQSVLIAKLEKDYQKSCLKTF